MHVTSGNETEIQITLETVVELANVLADTAEASADSAAESGGKIADSVRSLLLAQGFSRAATAPEAAVRRLIQRTNDLLPRLHQLPDGDVETTTMWVNGELTELTISPSLSDHDGAGLHIHWTPSSATFDDQVMADALMALAQELCDTGTRRFGRCAAEDCEHLFYDSTRNGSRRFCSDSRCASRTHTADHRRRRRAS